MILTVRATSHVPIVTLWTIINIAWRCSSSFAPPLARLNVYKIYQCVHSCAILVLLTVTASSNYTRRSSSLDHQISPPSCENVTKDNSLSDVGTNNRSPITSIAISICLWMSSNDSGVNGSFGSTMATISASSGMSHNASHSYCPFPIYKYTSSVSWNPLR